ncbi:MAG: hypothetical protein WCE62_08740 [Polyangiales bacterium]
MTIQNALLSLVFLSTVVACAHTSQPAPVREPAAQSSEPAYLFVQSAQSVESGPGTLTLKGVSPTTIYFTDRPKRTAGHGRTSDFVSMWGEGEDSFSADPPNATLSILEGDEEIADVVVTLRNPRLEGQNLTYDVQTLEGDLPRTGGAAALFIDVLVARGPMLRGPRAVVIR